MKRLRQTGRWLADRLAEVRQTLTTRKVRNGIAAATVAVAVAAYFGLTGFSRISESQVEARLDELRPAQFTLSVTDGSTLFGPRIDNQLEQLGGLRGVQGVFAAATIDSLPGQPTFSPSTVSGQESPGVTIFATLSEPLSSGSSIRLAGRGYDRGHIRRGDAVAVLGDRAAADLGMPNLDGQPTIFLGGRPFAVIGVMSATSARTELRSSILIPYSAALQQFGARAFSSEQVTIRGESSEVPQLEKLAPYLFRPEKPDSVVVAALGDPVSLRSDLAAQIAALVWIVTLGTILFGTIVVAFTAYSSVSERSQEFGLRRAVGATTGDIAGQVIAEVLVIGLVGSAAGGMLAAGALAVVSATTGVAYPLTATELLAAPAMGALVGIVAGFLPVWSAVRVDPHTVLLG